MDNLDFISTLKYGKFTRNAATISKCNNCSSFTRNYLKYENRAICIKCIISFCLNPGLDEVDL